MIIYYSTYFKVLYCYSLIDVLLLDKIGMIYIFSLLECNVHQNSLVKILYSLGRPYYLMINSLHILIYSKCEYILKSKELSQKTIAEQHSHKKVKLIWMVFYDPSFQEELFNHESHLKMELLDSRRNEILVLQLVNDRLH